MEELTQKIRIKEPCFEFKINRHSRPAHRGPHPRPGQHPDLSRRVESTWNTTTPQADGAGGPGGPPRAQLCKHQHHHRRLEAPVRKPRPVSRAASGWPSHLDFSLLPWALKAWTKQRLATQVAEWAGGLCAVPREMWGSLRPVDRAGDQSEHSAPARRPSIPLGSRGNGTGATSHGQRP